MHAPSLHDDRLRHVPTDRWDRARLVLHRGWLRDVRQFGAVATATCSGLVGVRVRVDLDSLASRCECATPMPCEHALALLIHLQPAAAPAAHVTRHLPHDAGAASPAPAPAMSPAAPPAHAPVHTPHGMTVRMSPGDPGRVLLEDRAPVADAVAEVLRWVWWTRLDARRLSGEARTLAQALQLLAQRGHHLAPPPAGELSGARAGFHQRALADPIHIRIEAPASDEGLALAKLLLDRGAHPYPGEVPAPLWTIRDESRFAAFLLQATAAGARVEPDLQLNPKPLRGVAVDLDPGCLPARLRQAGPGGAAEHLVLREFLEACFQAPLVVDDAHEHVLVPATHVVDVEEGLRALGADVHYKRLAPAGTRHQAWQEQAPEDMVGARPRLREPFHGRLTTAPPNLKPGTQLAPYQEEAVAFILHHGHTCLLADDMGLGKTLEAIAAAQFLPGRILVVCPASARQVWEREVGKFTLEQARVLGPGASPDEAHGPEKYVVTGYNNLDHVAEGLRGESFDLVILDESHYVKNAATGRSRSVRELLSPIPRRLVVSGTPVMNTPEEIRAQLAFLHPEEWSDVAWFHRRFAEPFSDGSPEVREAVLKRLRQFLEGVMIRREKATALPDLPPKQILWHRVALPGEARRAYVALEEEFEAFVQAEGTGSLNSAKASGKLERLKQTALAGKMPAAVAFVRELLAAGDKVVLFSRYRNALTSLAKELAPYGPVTLHGDTKPEERGEAERRFQEDPTCRVFLGQLVAAGTALTLVAGTHAVFLDLDWNPANHRQAMDRIHRRGQTRQVTAHFFLAEGTVDEDVAHVLDDKGRMMDTLLAPSLPEGRADLKAARRLVGERLLARRGPSATPSATP